jgi:hypothetical protein
VNKAKDDDVFKFKDFYKKNNGVFKTQTKNIAYLKRKQYNDELKTQT